jgi:hypothetical protein
MVARGLAVVAASGSSEAADRPSPRRQGASPILAGLFHVSGPTIEPRIDIYRRTDHPIGLGRDWKRQKRVEEAGSCRVKRQQSIECLRVKRQQSIELLCGRHVCRSLASTRGDLVELTVRQRYWTFSIR